MFDLLKSGWDAIVGGVATASMNVAGGTASAVTSMSAEWQAAVNDLKSKAGEFTRVYELLQSERKNATPEQQVVIDRLLTRGAWVRNTVAGVMTALNLGTNMLPKNLSGLALSRGRLGALPLVPIAVIVGGISVMTAWLADAYVELRKMDLAEKGIKIPGENAGIPSWVVYPVLGLGVYMMYRAARGR
jgi:hypothetical protein